MKIRSLFLLAVLAGCTAPVEEVGEVEEALQCAPETPPEIAVPDGHKYAFTFDATGVQMYECRATATGGFAWTFVAPEADLLRRGRIRGSHYVGPTWEALDGSTVVGARAAGVTVDATAIPWLLLRAVSNTGDGKMSEVTYIQRVDTVGGLAPASGCDAASVGADADVDYTAVYHFYRARD
jgi:hypothetical protein